MREFIIRTKNYLLILLAIYLGYLAINYFKGREAPECADKATINNVYSIFKNKIFPNVGISKDDISNMSLTLSNIVTLDKNSNTGAYFCRGNLTTKFNDEETTNIVEYNNRLVEDSDKHSFLTSITKY